MTAAHQPQKLTRPQRGTSRKVPAGVSYIFLFQPEMQHPNSSAIYKLAGRLPHLADMDRHATARLMHCSKMGMVAGREAGDSYDSDRYSAALSKTACRAASRYRPTSVTRSSPYWPKKHDGLSYSNIPLPFSSSNRTTRSGA